MFNFDDYKENIKQKLKEKLKIEIEQWDDHYFKKYDKKTWITYARRARKIMTEYGIITYKRRQYQNRFTKELRFFTDEYFGVERKKLITKNLKKLVYGHITTGKKNNEIMQTLPFAQISNTAISKILSHQNPCDLKNIPIKKNIS